MEILNRFVCENEGKEKNIMNKLVIGIIIGLNDDCMTIYFLYFINDSINNRFDTCLPSGRAIAACLCERVYFLMNNFIRN